MAAFDTLIRNGTIVTSSDRTACDIAIRDGKIVALGTDLGSADTEIDASGLLALPGGVESHCHIEQKSSLGIMGADDFYSATVSAVHGGTTTVVPFAAQHRGDSLRKVVDDYRALAEPKAVIDYGIHLIVSDPTPQVLGQELPALVADGFTSFKVYMTYDMLKIDDYQMLDILVVARELGAMMMVHAENHDIIRWLGDRLLDRGYRKPKYHTVSHPRLGEGEAAHRAIALSTLIDTPLLIVHVSAEAAMNEIRRAQDAGLKIYGETCPQYLFLTAKDMDQDGIDGARYCCTPPPRDEAEQEAIWRGIANGTFQVFSSDHAPFHIDPADWDGRGPEPTFKQITSGIPGIELRLPLLFSEGVGKGRIDLHRFVDLAATNAAKIYGLYPRKGTLAVGSDADIALWDPEREVTITYDILHDKAGYTPYEGRRIRGWPVTVLSRGRIAVQDGELRLERGSGAFLRRELSDAARPLGRLQPELDPARNFDATLLPAT